MTRTLATLLAAGLLLGADPKAQAQEEAAVTIGMTEDAFEPEHVTIQVGDTIEWTNPSRRFHTVTADPDKAEDSENVVLPEGVEPFDSGRINPEETYRRTFDVPGFYRYFCIPHERMGMVGSIEVEPSEDAEDTTAEEEQEREPPTEAPASPDSPPDTGLPRLLEWLGNFHPPSVNFPIALLITAAIVELLFLATGRPMFDHAVRVCVWFGAVGAVGAALLGWFFAGFQLTDADWVMTTHRWLGTFAAIWAVLVLVLVERIQRPESAPLRFWFRLALFLAAAVVGLNGFFGGALIYGLDHYAW